MKFKLETRIIKCMYTRNNRKKKLGTNINFNVFSACKCNFDTYTHTNAHVKKKRLIYDFSKP